MGLKYKNNNTDYYIGSKDIINLLINNLNNNKLQNSVILYGDRGIGKSTLVYSIVSRIFDKSINNNDDELEGEYSKTNITHPNFYKISPLYDDEKKSYKNEIVVDQIRELNNYINLTSFDNLPKIILIDSADNLNINASNALLKIIEEPKKNIYFFLISHHLNNLLATVRSRCIKLRVKNPNIDDFKKIININGYNISEIEINDLFYLSRASPGISIDFIDNNFFEIENNIIDLLINKEPLSDNLISFATLASKNNSFFSIFIYISRYILTNIIKYHYGVYESENSFISKYIKKISNLNTPKTVFELLDYLSQYELKIKTFNLDKKLFIINFFSYLKVN